MNELWWVRLAWSQFWQVTLTAAVVWLIVRFCARRRPRLAYLLWMLVVVKCVTPPIWTSPVGVFSRLRSPATMPTAADSPSGAVYELQYASEKLEAPLAARPKTRDAASQSLKLVVLEQPLRSATTVREYRVPFLIVAGLWLCGAMAVAGRIAWKWMRFSQSLQTGRAADAVTEQVLELAVKLSLRQLPRVVWTRIATVPAVYGYWRPTIVLPEFLLRPDVDVDLEPILAHELIHVRRGDTLAGRLQLFVQTLWWFHPCVWWVNDEARRERERSCDELVIALMDYEPLRYANCLVRIAELSQRFRTAASYCPPTCVAAIGSFQLLANRLEHITSHADGFRGQTSLIYASAVALLAALLLPGSATSVMSGAPLRMTSLSNKRSPRLLNDFGPAANNPIRPVSADGANSPEPKLHAPVITGIQIDGNLDDWPATMPRQALTKIHPDGASSWYGRDFSSSPDLSCEFRVGYGPEEQMLYVGVVVHDDKLILGNSSHRDTDALELYFDGLRSKRRYGGYVGDDQWWFEKADLRNLPVQQYCAIPGKGAVYGSSKQTNPLLIAGDLENTKTRMEYSRVNNTITYEWAVQVFDRYPDRPTKLEPGKRIGFDLAVVDKDVPLVGSIEREPQANRRAWIYWGPQWQGMKVLNAGNLGEIVLGE